MTLQYNTGGVPSMVFRSDSVLNGGGRSRRNDANGMGAVDVAFFANQLQGYDERAFKIIKGDLIAMDLFPVKLVDKGMATYSYQMYNSTGTAEYNTSKAKNAPLVNTSAALTSTNIATLTVAYEFTVEDMEASQFANSRPNLPNYDPITALRDQCLRACMERMDATVFHGYSDLNLNGFVNNPAITNSKNVGVAWTTATPQQILADLQDAYQSSYVSTLNKIKPDTCVMALALFNQIQNQIFNTYSGQTILQVFEGQTGIRVIPAAELNGAFNIVNGAGRDGFFMFKNDPMCIEHVVSIMFEQDAPIRKESGFAYTVPCRARHAGLVIRQPLTCSIRKQPLPQGKSINNIETGFKEDKIEDKSKVNKN
jgi:hypothetical protein